MFAKRERRGVTLVELLIAAAIVGVLAAIFIPVLIFLRAGAREAACLRERSALTRQMLAYRMLNEDYSLEQLFNGECPELDLSPSACPSGGEYSYVDERIVCGVHDPPREGRYFTNRGTASVVRDLFLTVPGCFAKLLGDGVRIPTDSNGAIGNRTITLSDGRSEPLYNLLFRQYGVTADPDIIIPSLKIYTVKASSGVTSSEDARLSSIIYKSGSRWIVTYPNFDAYSVEDSWGSSNRARFVRDESFLLRHMLNHPDDDTVRIFED